MTEHAKDNRHAKKVLGLEIGQSCIDLASQMLQKDPAGQVVWSENHAYFVPSSASADEHVINLPMEVRSGEQSISTQLPDKTLSQLGAALIEGTAMNITNLIKRNIKK